MSSPFPITDELIDQLNHLRTAECSTFTRDGHLALVPVVPVWDATTSTLVFATAVALAQKAYNLRRNPHVSLLFSDPLGSGLAHPPVILVQGTVRITEDLAAQRLTELAPLFSAKVPEQNYHLSPIMRRLMDWYYVRLMLDITPERVLVWADGDQTRAPAIIGSDVPALAPAAAASAPAWEAKWAQLATQYPTATLSFAGDDQYAYSYRTRAQPDAAKQALVLEPPAAGLPALTPGGHYTATLLFHRYGASMKQETLAQFQLRGQLIAPSPDAAPLFIPAQFIPGFGSKVGDHATGFEQMISFARTVREGKRKTREYMTKRTFQST